MLLFKRIGLFFIFFSLFFGCRKATNANWDVDLTIPVVNSLLNIKNFVNDSLFQSDNTGLLSVRINREVASIKLDSLLALPDTIIKIPFVNTSPIPLNFNIGQSITSFPPAELKFDIANGVALKKIDIHKGIMTVKFSNLISQPVDLTYKITSATKNGEVLTIKETVPTGTNSVIRNYDLTGYSLNMRGISGLVYNTIVQTYTFALSTTATSSLTLNYGDGAKVEVTYSGIVPEYVEGYFGQQTIDIKQDTASFGIIDNFETSNFMLSDATMDFSILNEFGAEFTSFLGNNKSINSPNNNVVSLNTNALSNININRATKAGTTIYPSVKLISFNKSNSNITSFISNLPDKLTYSGTIKVNPLGNISGYNDFAFYNTGIRILANIDIPLKFTADYFELKSTTDVNFSNIKELDDVNYGNFLIVAKNGFPFSVKLQGYMLDDQSTVIDSLFLPGSNVIESADLSANNEVLAPTEKKITVPVNRSKIENLKKCKKIKIVSRFILPLNKLDIKIYESYEVKINVIANLNYNVGFGG
ncbi:hypothetical protein [Aurantibacillus circumpalustris]|uniref:hypothetical protein n=1 Tax=Aurantibacillus circumpalustris TaxID=3036359 RepID=UPI00295AD11E|nr:hypothetical protein [Aurantibacillus circumpalustris]